MSARFAHTCLRVCDPEASVRFYSALGFQPCGCLELGGAYNLYLGLPGDRDALELTVNRDALDRYELGTSFGHLALVVDDIDARWPACWRRPASLPSGPLTGPAAGRIIH